MNKATIHHFQDKSLHGFPLIWVWEFYSKHENIFIFIYFISILFLVFSILFITTNVALLTNRRVWWLTWLPHSPTSFDEAQSSSSGSAGCWYYWCCCVYMWETSYCSDDAIPHVCCVRSRLCYVFTHLLLLQAEGVGTVWKLRDTPYNRVLKVKPRWWRRTHLRTITTLHTWG